MRTYDRVLKLRMWDVLKYSLGTIHLRRRHVLGGEGGPHCQCLPMLGGQGFQVCRRQQFLKVSGDTFVKKKYEKPIERNGQSIILLE